MEIQCACGEFKAEIKNLPKQTPGRLGCYCDDCQSYLIHLGRTDLLGEAGCTEVVPVYPRNIAFKSGAAKLECLRLSEKGMFRFFTTCCNSPITNTKPGSPWAGVLAHSFNHKDARTLEKVFGPIKSRIMGSFAKGEPATGTANALNFKAFTSVFPFLLKGFLHKGLRTSPFFKEDGATPIAKTEIMSESSRRELRKKFEKVKSYV